MFGLFDDPFYTNDNLLLNYLVNDYLDNKQEKNTETSKQSSEEKKNTQQITPHKSTEIFSWKPRSDIHETENSYVIDAELPGVPKEAINLSVKDDILTISGKKETKKEWDDTNKEGKKPICHHMERSFGSFQRSYALPEHLDPATIKASCNNGILSITIPKQKKSEPEVHTITIQ